MTFSDMASSSPAASASPPPAGETESAQRRRLRFSPTASIRVISNRILGIRSSTLSSTSAHPPLRPPSSAAAGDEGGRGGRGDGPEDVGRDEGDLVPPSATTAEAANMAPSRPLPPTGPTRQGSILKKSGGGGGGGGEKKRASFSIPDERAPPPSTSSTAEPWRWKSRYQNHERRSTGEHSQYSSGATSAASSSGGGGGPRSSSTPPSWMGRLWFGGGSYGGRWGSSDGSGGNLGHGAASVSLGDRASVGRSSGRSSDGTDGGGGSSDRDDGSHDRGGGRGSRCAAAVERCCAAACRPMRPSPLALDRMRKIVRARSWSVIVLFFTLILLFGTQVQELWCPPDMDMAFEVLYLAAFVVLGADIVLRCYTDPSYFAWQVRGGGAGRDHRAASGARQASGNWCGCLRMGSFMFWCDLISTLTLLYDISFINQLLTETPTVSIVLDSFGIPVEGLDDVNKPYPVETEWEILIVIGRTARVARFIRASTVVKTSSQVNWYSIFFKHLNPFYYIRLCLCGQYGLRGEASPTSSSSPPPPSSAGAAGTAGSIGGPGSTDGVGQGSPSPNAAMGPNASQRGGKWGSFVAAAPPPPPSDGGGRSGERPGGLFGLVLGLLGFRNDKSADDMSSSRRRMSNLTEHAAQTTVRGSAAEGPAVEVNGEGPGERGAYGKAKAPRSKKTSVISSVLDFRRTASTASSSGGSAARRRNESSQVGSAMRELTGQRVALGIMIALVLTVLFTYTEADATNSGTMIVLHTQTQNGAFASVSIDAARSSSVPDLYMYKMVNGTVLTYPLEDGIDPDDLRDREKLIIEIEDAQGGRTSGWFNNRAARQDSALVELVDTIFILLIWFFGVTAFAGPVMTLVVVPIERMIRLLSMLMRDPLGYQSSPRYQKFVSEEEEFTKNTRWTKDVLKGMETSFLMSTILRIGSLMKVGFGSAGVEIIRKNLEKGQRKDVLFLNQQGSTVSCIFLFCDIRQFTDATECLQEEVFVFTNKIAAVVHSICHSYGGSANKNVGDAFLLSWLLDDDPEKLDASERDSFGDSFTSNDDLLRRRPSEVFSGGMPDELHANRNQADKALLSVVKICIALYHDKHFLESMSEKARDRLLEKLKKRKGPVVQMGLGLHAGKAVQGAIGSQRKLDATYVSESVERAEMLESSTKKYGLKMLMSNAFHELLHPSNQRRCRKIDQILIRNDDDDDNSDTGDLLETSDLMELFTFDMDIEALWKAPPKPAVVASDETGSVKSDDASHQTTSNEINNASFTSKRNMNMLKGRKDLKSKRNLGEGGGILRRRSYLVGFGSVKNQSGSFHTGAENIELSDSVRGVGRPKERQSSNSAEPGTGAPANSPNSPDGGDSETIQMPELILPTGPLKYDANVWVEPEMKRIRQLYSDGAFPFFQKFDAGLKSYYARDWEHAKQCFVTILNQFDDGPSRYFLNIIVENDCVPPRTFTGYGEG